MFVSEHLYSQRQYMNMVKYNMQICLFNILLHDLTITLCGNLLLRLCAYLMCLWQEGSGYFIRTRLEMCKSVRVLACLP